MAAEHSTEDSAPTDTIRLFAGDCTTEFVGTRKQTQRGTVLIVVKPDRTVLVHDADGYQPVAWLTRPDEITIESDDRGFSIVATAAEQTLRVVSNANPLQWEVPIGGAGTPVGTCPDCEGPFVRIRGDVQCLVCGDRYGLPAGASVLDTTCDDCRLPQMAVERGDRFELFALIIGAKGLQTPFAIDSMVNGVAPTVGRHCVSKARMGGSSSAVMAIPSVKPHSRFQPAV